MEVKQSTCNYCSLACNVDFHVKDGEIKKVVPTKHYPVNKGFCCIKGLNLDKQNSRIENPKLPLLRDKEGNMKQIDWNTAFETFADKINDIQEKYGKESFAFISTGQLTTEEMALLGHIGRTYLGGNGDGNTRLCMATSVVAHKQSFGFDAPPYTLKDLELSDTIIFIGANPVVAHPILWGRVRKNKEAKVIVVDPRKSETALNADIWIDIKPKADLTLLYTLANVLIQREWIDKDYIEKYTEDFDGFKKHVSMFTLEDVEKNTGISKERVLELAEIIHNGKRVSFWWTMGVNQGYQAVRTAQGVINLAIMTGNIGKPGTGANSITGQCNAMGSRLFSNTTGLYGGGEYNNEKRRNVVAESIGINPEMLPTKPTLPYNVIIEKIISGEIKALWIVATNPRHSWSNNLQFKEAIDNLDFFVVQDIYADTDSAKLCDLLLPSTAAIKKEGVIINTERRLSAVTQVLSKEENELSDYDIFLGIGKALGMGSLLDNWSTPKKAFDILKKCTKGMPCDITGVDYEMLIGSKGIQWPFKAGDKLEEDERRLFEDNKYYTESKKAKFIYEDIAENPVKEDSEYPYFLNTGRGTVGQWHTQTRTREINLVKDITLKDSYIYMNTELAKELKIEENERIVVSSKNNHEDEFVVKITDNVKKDQLYAPIHYIATNVLTPSVYDAYSKEPSYKAVGVKIRKIDK